jgi:GAF domain-containing protein
MRAEVQSALAIPLMNRDRCIGVIEMQSTGVGGFKEATIGTMEQLTQPLGVSLEDAWLFESGWLVRQVRDALRHLWDDLYLGRMALADWALAEKEPRKERTTGGRGAELRNLLLQTIETMEPQETHNANHNVRSYRILQLTYAQEQAVEQILHTLHISRRQYFYDLKDSIEVLTDLLVRNHH